MYAILIISLLLVLGTLKTIQNRKTIIDKLKSETVNAVDSNNYQELLNRVVALEEKERKRCVMTAHLNSYTISETRTYEAVDYNTNSIFYSNTHCGLSLVNGKIIVNEGINKIKVSGYVSYNYTSSSTIAQMYIGVGSDGIWMNVPKGNNTYASSSSASKVFNVTEGTEIVVGVRSLDGVGDILSNASYITIEVVE